MGDTPVVAHDLMSREYTIKEAGYVFMYVSNENATLVDVYFDDVVMTHTKGNVVQYNEYYPFGMQTSNSWTRENTTGNNFLGNGGTELNTTSNLYDLAYRNYDPILGRMNQIDPMATKYASLTPYNFSFNDPVTFTDPSGADPFDNCSVCNPSYTLESSRFGNNVGYRNDIIMDPGGRSNAGGGMLAGSFAAADAYFQNGGIIQMLERLFHDASFSSGGLNGFWIKTTGVNTATEGLKWGDATILAEVLNRNIFVSNISQAHFNAMLNPLAQDIHSGQEAFANNPFGGGLMAFLSGGGLMGGGAIAGRTLSGLKMLQPLVVRGGSALIQSANIGGRTIVNNLMQTGVRNALINLSVQSIFNGKNIDRADVLISAISGNYFMFSSLASALVDNTSSFGFQTAADKSIYQTSVDAATGMAFGFAAGQAGKAIGPNGGAGIVDFTINLYGGLTNWALAPPSKKP